MRRAGKETPIFGRSVTASKHPGSSKPTTFLPATRRLEDSSTAVMVAARNNDRGVGFYGVNQIDARR